MFELPMATIAVSRGVSLGFPGIGLVAVLLLGAIGVCVAAALFMVLNLWPESTGVARRPTRAKATPKGEPFPPRCSNCGYDLRASPQYCPECGTPRAKRQARPMPDGDVPQRQGLAWIVQFRTRSDSIDLRVATEQLGVIATLRRLCPEATELVLAPPGQTHPTAIASETLAAAAEGLLQALKSADSSPAIQIALRRVCQFARRHGFARVERMVQCRRSEPDVRPRLL